MKYNIWKWYNWRWLVFPLTTWHISITETENVIFPLALIADVMKFTLLLLLF